MATRKGVNDAGAGVGVGASSGGTAASPDRKSGKSSVSFNDYHASWSALATTKKKAVVVTPTTTNANAPPRAPTNDTDTRPHRASSARNDTIIEKMKCGTAERYWFPDVATSGVQQRQYRPRRSDAAVVNVGSPTHGTDPPPLKSSPIPLWPAEDPEPDEGDVAALLQFAKSLNVSEIERYD
eukprot:m.95695 g.95695  ORF g.95695 m.95695 type:complete len:182 (-) comp20430_c0_seq1:367-912(-)